MFRYNGCRLARVTETVTLVSIIEVVGLSQTDVRACAATMLLWIR
jgi:hypothetical protein